MASEEASIRFLGAAETVTGSRYLVDWAGRRLLVDCGLFQGWKKLRERNWARFPVDPASVDAVIFTHAHIDHTGYFPRFCAAGFAGRAYCTPGTRDLLQILLPDAGHLQEEEARHANRRGYAKHHPALPLYTRAEAERSLEQLSPVAVHRPFAPASGVTARFSRAGHIVGSACLELVLGDTTLTFTGDVGRPADPIMRAPEPLGPTDVLVTESTYGDRRHPAEDVAAAIARIARETFAKRGAMVVPSFAVGRSQHLLHVVAGLIDAGRIPQVPVFLDSPMAIAATGVFQEHADDHKLSVDECARMGELARYARTPDDSKAIDTSAGPMIVISASGMATGGRVLHHLCRFLPERHNTILFVGFQAAGTRGRSLVDGADEIKLLGRYVPVRARIAKIDSLSAHADYHELMGWLGRTSLAPRRVFVTHGEPAAADALRRRLHERFGWQVVVPEDGSTWSLT